jgi:hypothetical protein
MGASNVSQFQSFVRLRSLSKIFTFEMKISLIGNPRSFLPADHNSAVPLHREHVIILALPVGQAHLSMINAVAFRLCFSACIQHSVFALEQP